MKKILFVNNNLETGGIQKALINMLKCISNEYDVTLLLFSKTGALISEIPKEVKVITPQKSYAMLGLERKDLKKHPLLCVYKMTMKIITKLYGKTYAMNVLGLFQERIGTYDVAFSVSHLSNFYSFNNGCAEFVLNKISAKKKMCFVHCDYVDSGFVSEENNNLYRMFDQIICVSKSVKQRLMCEIPDLDGKTVVARNFYDLNIKEKAEENPMIYDESYINMVVVARLSIEKGIDRAIIALRRCKRRDIRIHIVGDGPLKENLKKRVLEEKLQEQVFFYGEQINPYRYIKNADYLLVSSLHEAAPMVFDEAHILNVPIISTKLLSTSEMLMEKDIVCENSCEGIETALLNAKKKDVENIDIVSNDENIRNIRIIIEGNCNETSEI